LPNWGWCTSEGVGRCGKRPSPSFHISDWAHLWRKLIMGIYLPPTMRIPVSCGQPDS
jgi:hypothetical protein